MKKETKQSWILKTACLPDPTHPANIKKISGRLGETIESASEYVAHNIAELGAGSASLAVRYEYVPLSGCPQSQQRLRIYLCGMGHDSSGCEIVPVLLNNYQFKTFYRFEKCNTFRIDPKIFKSCCDIIRNYSIIKPAVTAEINSAVPSAGYLSVESFKASKKQLINFVNFLSDINEHVLVDIAIEPVDISNIITAHNSYLCRLRQINQNSDMLGGYLNNNLLVDNTFTPCLKQIHTKDPVSDSVYRSQLRLAEQMSSQPHLRFHIRIYAETNPTAGFVASVFAGTVFEKGSYRLIKTDNCENLLNTSINTANVITVDQKLEFAGLFANYNKIIKLTNIATVDQLKSVFTLPMALPHSSPKTILKDTDPPDVDPADMIIVGKDSDFNDISPVFRGIRIKDLVKHLLGLGKSGKGKTTECINFIIQLCILGVTVIIFECGTKAPEYRALKYLKHHPDKRIRKWVRSLPVYTVGAEFGTFRHNPLALDDTISIEENIERLLLCFESSMPMEGSIIFILGKALEKLYRQCDDPYKNPPTMKDLLKVVEEILDRMGYSADVKSDLTTAIMNRLGMMTRRMMGSVFNCRQNTPSIQQLACGSCVIELSRLTPKYQAFLMFVLLTALCRYFGSTSKTDAPVRCMILVEEAGTVIGTNTDAQASETNTDPKTFASELIVRMLQQLRGERVGLGLLNQTVKSISPDILKNVGSKFAFGTDHADERDTIGGAMLFGDIETVDIASLVPGQCYFITEGYHAARKLEVPNIIEQLNIPDAPKGNGIIELIKDEKWFIDEMNTILAYETGQLNVDMDLFNDRLSNFIDRLKSLIASSNSANDATMIKKMRLLRQDILDSLDDFLGDSFLPLTRTVVPEGIAGNLVNKRTYLIKNFETIIKPAAAACIDTLDKYIETFGRKEI